MTQPNAPRNAFTVAIARAVRPEDAAGYLEKHGWRRVPNSPLSSLAFVSPDGKEEMGLPSNPDSDGYGRTMLSRLDWMAMDANRDVSYDLAFVAFAAEVAAHNHREAEVYRVLKEYWPDGPKVGANGTAATGELVATGT